MPLLAYCIAEAGSNIEVPPRGVQGASLRTLVDSGLNCFLSDYDASARHANYIRETALDFNRVLQDLLNQVAIIPFRFPTLLNDESEIRNFLQQHAAEYRDVLDRLRDVAQIEVNLTVKNPRQSEGSGKEYLLSRQHSNQRLADAADQVRQQLGTHIQGWHEHQRSNATRCYMLVSRRDLGNAFEKLRELKMPPELQARVTGPWPPTEFIALPPDAQAEAPSNANGEPGITEKIYDQ
jgi:Gas vesicle synthesis protein GvpL/GvpF